MISTADTDRDSDSDPDTEGSWHSNDKRCVTGGPSEWQKTEVATFLRRTLTATPVPGGIVKKAKNCPACGGSEMYFREVSARGGHGPDLLPKVGGFFRGGRFEIYICGACGHTQFFVPDELLPTVKEKYERAW